MKKIIAIVLCALLAVPYCGTVLAADTTVNFTDVQADSAQGKAIYILAAAGIVNGNGDGTFAPDRGVTRAELCKMVNNIYGYTAEDETSFSDVTPDKWYYSHVKIAKKAGYITGFEDGTFRGDTPVTREQACAIVVRVAGIYDLGLPITIADAVSPWAEGYVKTIIANQLMQLEEGNCFRATEPMTRGELSIPLSNFVGSVGSGSAQTGGTSTGGVSIGGSSGSGGSSSGGSSSGGSGSGSSGSGGSGSGSSSSGGSSTGSSSSGSSSSGGNTGSGSTGSETDKNDPVIDSSGSTDSENTGSDNSGSVESDTNKDTEYTVTVKGAGIDVTETKKDGSIYKLPVPTENADTFSHWADEANGLTKESGSIIFVRGNYNFTAVFKEVDDSEDNNGGDSGEAPDTGDNDNDNPAAPDDTFDQAEQAKVVEYLNRAKASLEKIEFGKDVLDIMCDAILATLDKTLADADKGIKIYEEGYVEATYPGDIESVRKEYNSWSSSTQTTFKNKLATDIDSYVAEYLLKVMFGEDINDYLS